MAAVLVAAATGCGGDDGADQAAPDQQTVEATEGTPTTSPTQPDASDEEAVRPFIEDLLAQWDEHMSAVLVDPEPVADTPDHPLAREMAGSFTEDSPFMTDLTGFSGHATGSWEPLPGEGRTAAQRRRLNDQVTRSSPTPSLAQVAAGSRPSKLASR